MANVMAVAVGLPCPQSIFGNEAHGELTYICLDGGPPRKPAGDDSPQAAVARRLCAIKRCNFLKPYVDVELKPSQRDGKVSSMPIIDLNVFLWFSLGYDEYAGIDSVESVKDFLLFMEGLHWH
eukprot:scaffold18778_cov154-Amphora_coffeaeformis.AAC.2